MNIYKDIFININIFVIVVSLFAKMIWRKMENRWKSNSGLKHY